MKKIIFYTIVVFVVIQFIPTTLPDIMEYNPNDLLVTSNVPENVATLLRTSCYDCHSNETVYPWYSYIAPVSFLVKRDTEKGREKLNFSNWNTFKKSKKAKYLDEIAEEVNEGKMPMKIYTFIHKDAKLSEKDKNIIINWSDEYAESLFSK
jgi:hypothetical protein